MSKTITKSILIVIALVLVIMLALPDKAAAVTETKRKDYTLMKGVTESEVYVSDSTRENIRIHILRINKGANISFKVNTKNYYKKSSTASSRKKAAKSWNSKKWGYSMVSAQAKNYNNSKDAVGTVIAASNGDFYATNGKTIGNLIMEGNTVRSSKAEPFFAVESDGDYAIKDPGSSTSGVKEAVSGMWLLRDGNYWVGEGGDREARQSIGITSSGDVVILNVDSDGPKSTGTNLYNAATILKQQGCVDAINLDGGGSASFLTKRTSNKNLVYRNETDEKYPRSVSSSLLVVKNKKSNGKTVSGDAVVKMTGETVSMKKDSKGVYTYKIGGEAQTGFHCYNGEMYLFDKNGKGISKTIKIGDNKYTYKGGKFKKSNDKKAGKTVISYCGSSNGGQDLIYAYQSGNAKLNIGINPLVSGKRKMPKWAGVRYVPWQKDIYNVKTVIVGKGVKSIGPYACYISLTPINETLKKKKSVLKTIKIGDSVKEIGRYAFFNHVNLKKVTLGKALKKTEPMSFGNAKKATFTFKNKAKPSLGAKTFSGTTKKAVIKTPKNSKVRKYLKKKSVIKKIKFKGKVK